MRIDYFRTSEKSTKLQISIKSTFKGNYRAIRQPYANGSLWIDGKKICRTRKNSLYIFHYVDGVLDHYFIADYWGYDTKEWKKVKHPNECEACESSSTSTTIDDEIPF